MDWKIRRKVCKWKEENKYRIGERKIKFIKNVRKRKEKIWKTWKIGKDLEKNNDKPKEIKDNIMKKI